MNSRIGKFHVIAALFVIPCIVCGDMQINNLAYFELWPDYYCTNTTTDAYYECDPDMFCNYDTHSVRDGLIITVNGKNDTSLENWVETLDLKCISKFRLGFIGSAYFMGWTIASLIVPRIADIYGRRWVFLSLMTLNFAAVLVSVFSHNVWLTTGCMFLCGIVAVGRWAIGYIMLLEFFPETQKKYLGSVA